MLNLLRFNDASEALGVKCSTLKVMSVYKPNWLVEIDGVKYVDVEIYDKQQSITRRCYEYNTSKLYWMMKELFKTDSAIAEYMSKKSKENSVVISWKKYISGMFAIPLNNGANLRRTLHSEFFRVSYKTISIAINKGYKFESINT